MSLQKKIKRILAQRQEQRLLKEYYFAGGSRPRGAWLTQYSLIFIILGALAVGDAGSFAKLTLNIFFALLLAGAIADLLNRRELVRAESFCRNRVSRREYNDRLERCSHQDVLNLLGEKIKSDYHSIESAVLANHLEVEYEGAKTEVYFVYPDENGFVETRDIMGILREVRQKAGQRVRIFTAGSFSSNAFSLAERYEIDLRLYDGDKLSAFLKDSILVPTKQEVDAIMKAEVQKRKKRSEIIKKQMLQRNKTGRYLFYAGLLFLSAWFKIGLVYWNLVFASILLCLGVVSLLLRKCSTEEEGFF